MTSTADEGHPLATCPDCTQDKHQACVGDAWDFVSDGPTVCACYLAGHREWGE